MTTLELENIVSTTDRWASGPSLSDQENPSTRRRTLDTVLIELETFLIERNAEFHAAIVERLAVAEPQVVDSNDVLTD